VCDMWVCDMCVWHILRVWHDSFMFVSMMCDMTHSIHDITTDTVHCVYVTRHVCVCDLTPVRVARLIYVLFMCDMCDMTHTNQKRPIQVTHTRCVTHTC